MEADAAQGPQCPTSQARTITGSTANGGCGGDDAAPDSGRRLLLLEAHGIRRPGQRRVLGRQVRVAPDARCLLLLKLEQVLVQAFEVVRYLCARAAGAVRAGDMAATR